MAFTLTFPTSGEMPDMDAVSAWLRERGEPFECPQPIAIQLRALDLRLELASESESMKGHLDVTSTTNLSRLVDLIFELSVFVGSDVRLAGVGEMSRGALWLSLADEQDRLRIGEALERAEVHNRRDEVGQRLWQVVAAIRPRRDDRWDAATSRVVELKEIGAPDGISVADAHWHTDEPELGEVIPVAVQGSVHTIAWRWLSEAYPGLAEAEHTFH